MQNFGKLQTDAGTHTHTPTERTHTHTTHTLRYARRVIQLPCTLLKHVPFSIGHFTSICMIKKTKVCDIIAFAISIYIWRLKCRLGARFYVTSAGFLKYLPYSKVSFSSMYKFVSEANVDRSSPSERLEPLQVTLYIVFSIGVGHKEDEPFFYSPS